MEQIRPELIREARAATTEVGKLFLSSVTISQSKYNAHIYRALDAIITCLEAAQSEPVQRVPVYAYTMRHRPPGYATLPDVSWEWVEAPGNGRLDLPGKPRSTHPWGVIATERELTPQEQADFELDPVPAHTLREAWDDAQ